MVERVKRQIPGRFKPGERGGPGRAKGQPNKTTKLLRDAVIMAAEAAGSDGKGKDGLVGYLTWLSQFHPTAFTTLLNKIIPMQVTGVNGQAIQFEQVPSREEFFAKLIGVASRVDPDGVDGTRNQVRRLLGPADGGSEVLDLKPESSGSPGPKLNGRGA